MLKDNEPISEHKDTWNLAKRWSVFGLNPVYIAGYFLF
jgi:hypothetical protein